MSLEEQLRSALHGGADHLHLPGAGAEAARRRARRIARRRRAVPAALTATMVAGASATVLVRRDEPESTVVAGRGSTATPTVVDSDFTWRAADGVVSAPRHIVRGDDGTYYALSTAPGTRSADHEDGIVPQALYRSTDGVTWEAAELGDKPWMIDIDERGGVLYAVGTSPATEERETVVRTSSDGGNSWDGITLPSVAEPPTTSLATTGQSSTARIAVGDDVMVAFLQTTYYADLDAVLTDEDRAADRYAMSTREGIAIVEPGGLAGVPCADMPEVRCATEVADPAIEAERAQGASWSEAVRTVPWSEVGLSGPDDLRVSEAFVSSDGRTWEAVASPFTGFGPTDVVATPDGFVATVTAWDDGTTELLRSADGRSWESVSAGLGTIDHVGVVGDRLIALRSDDAENASITLMTSDDAGASWTVADLSSVFDPEAAFAYDFVTAFDAGPMGVALVATGAGKGEAQEPRSALLTSPDGLTWSVEPLTDVVGSDSPEANWVDWVLVGENDVVVHAMGYSTEDGPVSKSFVGTPTR